MGRLAPKDELRTSLHNKAHDLRVWAALHARCGVRRGDPTCQGTKVAIIHWSYPFSILYHRKPPSKYAIVLQNNSK
jgi:hypothetical protein